MIVRIIRRIKTPSSYQVVRVVFILILIAALAMIVPLPGNYSLVRSLLF